MYAAGHPSGALRLMTAICEAFAELAKARGKRPLIVMLPLAASFRKHANDGQFEYAPLVAALRAKGIEVFDPGTAMLDVVAGRSATCRAGAGILGCLPLVLPGALQHFR
jgi:hypothetical protein